MFDVDFCKRGVTPDPKGVTHHFVCVLESTGYAILDIAKVRLFGQIAAKQQTSANSIFVQII